MSVDLRTLAKEVLQDAYLIALGVADSEGPWVASVIFVFDEDFNLYWLSKDAARHTKAIAQNPHFAGSIVAEYKKGEERALQLAGKVEKIAGPLFEQEKALRKKTGESLPTFPGETTPKHSWYRLTPERMELIYNVHFGFDRQRVL